MTTKFIRIREKIANIIASAQSEEEINHSILVHKWTLILFPQADESLQIAALSHDIDRVIAPRTNKKETESYLDYKMRHAKRSAYLIDLIMKEIGYESEMRNQVKNLVENHEIGGNEKVNFLKDADSIAYFEYNVKFYLKKMGPEITKEKMKFMYKRASERAKDYINKLVYTNNVNEIFAQVRSELSI